MTENEDIYKITASKIYGVPVEEVTEEQRQKAKAISFGYLYQSLPEDAIQIARDELINTLSKMTGAMERANEAMFQHFAEWFEELIELIKPIVIIFQRAYLYSQLSKYLPDKLAIFISEKCPVRWLPTITEKRVHSLQEELE
ncbi:hypothetical protein LCGC14_0466120 [marine sediment metagenome]|uniref:DNA-directed DNA polymerase family A palm domain-containing protein n=1 Tax=marine sediment metagenome TaxID=412755 RepID=A0A0F9SWF2_9ZZZZ